MGAGVALHWLVSVRGVMVLSSSCHTTVLSSILRAKAPAIAGHLQQFGFHGSTWIVRKPERHVRCWQAQGSSQPIGYAGRAIVLSSRSSINVSSWNPREQNAGCCVERLYFRLGPCREANRRVYAVRRGVRGAMRMCGAALACARACMQRGRTHLRPTTNSAACYQKR